MKNKYNLRNLCKSKKALVAILFAAFITPMIIGKSAFAGVGTSAGSGGQGNCNQPFFSTCFGASWKWYPIDPNDPNGDNIPIRGLAARPYAQSGNIIGCKKYGGYWRYAIVSDRAGTPFGEFYVNACDQVGLLGINHNADPTLDSEFYTGGRGMRFIPPGASCGGERTWQEMEALYNEYRAVAASQGEEWIGWGAPGPNGGVAWFCGGHDSPNTRVTYNYILEEEQCYGRPRTSHVDKSITELDDDRDNVVRIANNFALYKDRGYDFAGYESNPYLTGSDALYDTLTLPQNQSVTVNLHFVKSMSEEEEEQRCPCSSWVRTSYVNSNDHRGWSSVMIGVKNKSVTNDNSKWHHMTPSENQDQPVPNLPIYAKPTDQVQWKYCYFPGAQFAADSEVTQFNNHPEPTSGDTTLNNMLFKNAYSWESKVHIWTQNLKPGGENVDRVLDYGAGASPINTDPKTGTMPENKNWYGVQPRNQPTPFTQNPTVELDPGWTLRGNIQTYGHTPTYAERDDGTSHSWACRPYSCSCGEGCTTTCWHTCHHTNPFFRNNQGDYTVQADYADVIVPYNFKNRATATIKADNDDDPDNDVLYAGETVTVTNPVVTVDKRDNSETQGNYATQVDGGRAKLIAFLSEEDVEHKHYTWNSNIYDSDAYGNTAPEGGKIWRSSSDNPCGAVVSKFGVCEYLKEYDNITLNANSNLNGESRDLDKNNAQSLDYFYQEGKSVAGKYNVFDEAAGNYFCVAAAVYPFSVKSNTDADKVGGRTVGDYSWFVSTPSCVKIAKRPTFQVWGAGVYSRRGTEISTENVKNNLLGNENDQNQNDQNRITRGAVRNSDNYSYWSATGGTNSYFGSWSELTATIGGRNEHLASGASLGYQALGGRNGLARIDSSTSSNITANLGTAFGNPGGTQRLNNLCLRSPLTIPNSTCKSSYTGNSSGSSVINGISDTIKNDVQALINRFGDGTGTASTPEEDEARPYKVEPAAEIGDKTIGKGETIVNIINGPITIKGNITYATDGYTSSNEIPKYIIYARGSNGNVTVDCNVNRIDAIIIADKEFNSCNDEAHSDKTNEQKNTAIRSHQLVINGALVAGTVTLNRSFGANSGGNSIVPAELINYDSTIYLWAHRMASASVSGQLTESASRELAPRY